MNQDKEMFGISEETIREQYINSLTARLSGQEMVVASILSDCQEMLELGYDKGDIRKQLNIAKFILFEMLDKKREGESKYIGETV